MEGLTEKWSQIGRLKSKIRDLQRKPINSRIQWESPTEKDQGAQRFASSPVKSTHLQDDVMFSDIESVSTIPSKVAIHRDPEAIESGLVNLKEMIMKQKLRRAGSSDRSCTTQSSVDDREVKFIKPEEFSYRKTIPKHTVVEVPRKRKLVKATGSVTYAGFNEVEDAPIPKKKVVKKPVSKPESVTVKAAPQRKLATSALQSQNDIITPSSWRQGLKLTKKVLADATQDKTDTLDDRSTSEKSTTSSKTSTTKPHFSRRPAPKAKAVIDKPPVPPKTSKRPRGIASKPAPQRPNNDSVPKVASRHYDPAVVQEYIKKTKNDRRKQQVKAKMEKEKAEKEKAEKLQQLYNFQKRAVIRSIPSGHEVEREEKENILHQKKEKRSNSPVVSSSRQRWEKSPSPVDFLAVGDLTGADMRHNNLKSTDVSIPLMHNGSSNAYDLPDLIDLNKEDASTAAPLHELYEEQASQSHAAQTNLRQLEQMESIRRSALALSQKITEQRNKLAAESRKAANLSDVYKPPSPVGTLTASLSVETPKQVTGIPLHYKDSDELDSTLKFEKTSSKSHSSLSDTSTISERSNYAKDSCPFMPKPKELPRERFQIPLKPDPHSVINVFLRRRRLEEQRILDEDRTRAEVIEEMENRYESELEAMKRERMMEQQKLRELEMKIEADRKALEESKARSLGHEFDAQPSKDAFPAYASVTRDTFSARHVTPKSRDLKDNASFDYSEDTEDLLASDLDISSSDDFTTLTKSEKEPLYSPLTLERKFRGEFARYEASSLGIEHLNEVDYIQGTNTEQCNTKALAKALKESTRQHDAEINEFQTQMQKNVAELKERLSTLQTQAVIQKAHDLNERAEEKMKGSEDHISKAIAAHTDAVKQFTKALDRYPKDKSRRHRSSSSSSQKYSDLERTLTEAGTTSITSSHPTRDRKVSFSELNTQPQKTRTISSSSSSSTSKTTGNTTTPESDGYTMGKTNRGDDSTSHPQTQYSELFEEDRSATTIPETLLSADLTKRTSLPPTEFSVTSRRSGQDTSIPETGFSVDSSSEEDGITRTSLPPTEYSGDFSTETKRAKRDTSTLRTIYSVESDEDGKDGSSLPQTTYSVASSQGGTSKPGSTMVPATLYSLTSRSEAKTDVPGEDIATEYSRADSTAISRYSNAESTMRSEYTKATSKSRYLKDKSTYSEGNSTISSENSDEHSRSKSENSKEEVSVKSERSKDESNIKTEFSKEGSSIKSEYSDRYSGIKSGDSKDDSSIKSEYSIEITPSNRSSSERSSDQSKTPTSIKSGTSRDSSPDMGYSKTAVSDVSVPKTEFSKSKDTSTKKSLRSRDDSNRKTGDTKDTDSEKTDTTDSKSDCSKDTTSKKTDDTDSQTETTKEDSTPKTEYSYSQSSETPKSRGSGDDDATPTTNRSRDATTPKSDYSKDATTPRTDYSGTPRSDHSRDPDTPKSNYSSKGEESFRSVLPSESHRKTMSEHDSITSGAASRQDSFASFTLQIVDQFVKDENARDKHRKRLLKLKEDAVKEDAQAKLKWIQKQKRRLEKKGDDEKMPAILRKEKNILEELKLKQEEIQRLHERHRFARKERRILAKEQKDILRLRSSAAKYEKRNASGYDTDSDGDRSELVSDVQDKEAFQEHLQNLPKGILPIGLPHPTSTPIREQNNSSDGSLSDFDYTFSEINELESRISFLREELAKKKSEAKKLLRNEKLLKKEALLLQEKRLKKKIQVVTDVIERQKTQIESKLKIQSPVKATTPSRHESRDDTSISISLSVDPEHSTKLESPSRGRESRTISRPNVSLSIEGDPSDDSVDDVSVSLHSFKNLPISPSKLSELTPRPQSVHDDPSDSKTSHKSTRHSDDDATESSIPEELPSETGSYRSKASSVTPKPTNTWEMPPRIEELLEEKSVRPLSKLSDIQSYKISYDDDFESDTSDLKSEVDRKSTPRGTPRSVALGDISEHIEILPSEDRSVSVQRDAMPEPILSASPPKAKAPSEVRGWERDLEMGASPRDISRGDSTRTWSEGDSHEAVQRHVYDSPKRESDTSETRTQSESSQSETDISGRYEGSHRSPVDKSYDNKELTLSGSAANDTASPAANDRTNFLSSLPKRKPEEHVEDDEDTQSISASKTMSELENLISSQHHEKEDESEVSVIELSGQDVDAIEKEIQNARRQDEFGDDYTEGEMSSILQDTVSKMLKIRENKAQKELNASYKAMERSPTSPEGPMKGEFLNDTFSDRELEQALSLARDSSVALQMSQQDVLPIKVTVQNTAALTRDIALRATRHLVDSLRNRTPPSFSTFNLESEIPEDYTEIECNQAISYQKLVLHTTMECFSIVNWEYNLMGVPKPPPPAWMCEVKRDDRPFWMKYLPRKVNLNNIPDHLPDVVVMLLGLNDNTKPRKYQHMEDVLLQEVRDDNVEWTDYGFDEQMVKHRVADEIFYGLMEETLNVFKHISVKHDQLPHR